MEYLNVWWTSLEILLYYYKKNDFNVHSIVLQLLVVCNQDQAGEANDLQRAWRT